MRILRLVPVSKVLFCILLLVLYAAGCNQQERPSETNIKEEDERKQTIKIIAPYENILIRQAFIEVVGDYENIKKNMRVEIEFIPLESYQKELNMRMESGNLGDVIICENSIMPALIDRGIFTNISRYVNETNKTDSYNLNLWNNTRSDGLIYGIPVLLDPYVMYYNKKIFDDKEQIPPDTWEDFETVAHKVSMNNAGTYAFGFGARQSEETTNIFIHLLHSTGGSLRAVNDENGIKVFEMISRMGERELLAPDCINWSELDAVEMFRRGEIVMMFNKLSASTLLEDKGMNFDMGIEAIPYEKRETYLYYGDNAGIPIGADYQEAIAFIDYLTQENSVKKLAYLTHTIPVRIDLTYTYEDGDYFVSNEFIQNQFAYGVSKNSFNLWFNISDAISDGMWEIMTQHPKDIQEVADKVQDKVRTAIIEN